MMLDEALLRRLYLEEQHSIRGIAEILGLATRTVYDAMLHYRIPRRPPGGARPRRTGTSETVGSLDETTVRQLYLEAGQSIIEIARVARCSQASVRKAMIRWNIPRRRQGPRQWFQIRRPDSG